MKKPPKYSILAITDRVGDELTNGSQVFANALLIQLSYWFEITIIASKAVRPPERLKQRLIIIESEQELKSELLIGTTDPDSISVIYNLGATLFSSNVTNMLSEFLTGIPIVNHFQVLLPEYAHFEHLNNEHISGLVQLQEQIARRASRNIFPSFAELSLFLSRGWSDNRLCYVVPNAYIPAGNIRQTTKNPTFTFLAAGRFSDYVKGADMLYNAFIRFFKKYPDTHLKIAGDSDRFTKLLNPVPKESRSFLGWLSRDELIATMQAADVVVVPSRYEPFGLVAIEAMAVGTPVIAMAVGGLAEIIHHGYNGWLCPPGEGSLGLSIAMESAVSDKKFTSTLGENARQKVLNEYSLSRIAMTIRAHLDNVIHGNGLRSIRNKLAQISYNKRS